MKKICKENPILRDAQKFSNLFLIFLIFYFKTTDVLYSQWKRSPQKNKKMQNKRKEATL